MTLHLNEVIENIVDKQIQVQAELNRFKMKLFEHPDITYDVTMLIVENMITDLDESIERLSDSFIIKWTR